MRKFFLKFLSKKQKGFTLIEVLVSVFIVITLTTLVLANFEWGGYNFALERSLRGLSQQIRVVQEMALSSREVDGSVPKGGYGIYLEETNLQKYILFADYEKGGGELRTYGPEDTIIGEYFLEKDVLISGLYFHSSPLNRLNVVFFPPDPKVYISSGNGVLAGGGPDFFARIILSAANGATGSVSINGAGLIEVEK